MFSVAVATYLSLYPSMLIIPVILMLTRKINDNDLTKVAIFWLSNAWKEFSNWKDIDWMTNRYAF